MPFKMTRFFTILIFLTSLSLTSISQTTTSAAEVLKERIDKAKAYLAVKNYSAGIYELENIRRETTDKTIKRAITVLLMHAYLEQGDYVRAQSFLEKIHKAKTPTAPVDYIAVAGQVVSGANTLLKRYTSLGLNVSDNSLPEYAKKDVDEMRKLLELTAKHSKELGTNKTYTINSLALLEEIGNARSSIAKDEYDAKQWKNEVMYARNQLSNSGSKVINAVDNPPINAPDPTIIAVSTQKEDTQTDNISEEEKSSTNDEALLPKKRPKKIIKSADKNYGKTVSEKETEDNDSKVAEDAEKTKPIKNNTVENTGVKTTKKDKPLEVGALTDYATKKVNPVYPRQAKNLRMTGVVKVELVIDEKGKVAKVENASGPSLLKNAARSAIKRWQFKPFMRDGQPVKATGFVHFRFSL